MPDFLVDENLPARLPIDDQVRIVVSSIASLDPTDLPGNIVVVEPGRVRVRKARMQG